MSTCIHTLCAWLEGEQECKYMVGAKVHGGPVDSVFNAAHLMRAPTADRPAIAPF